MNELKKYWWLTLIKGIVLLLLSFFVFRHPVDALVGVAIYIGLSLLFMGILQTSTSIYSRKMVENWGWGLAVGIIDILFGFVLLSNPALTAATLPFVVGFWIIVSGIMIFANAFQSRKEGFSLWWMGLLGGIFSVFVGLFITNNFAAGMLAISAWMGIGFAIAGIVNVVVGFQLRNAQV